MRWTSNEVSQYPAHAWNEESVFQPSSPVITSLFWLYVDPFNSNTIHLFSEHQSIKAVKTHSEFTKRWWHRTYGLSKYFL